MKREEANSLYTNYKMIAGKTYDNKYFNALVIVPNNGENVKELVHFVMHNEPIQAVNLLDNYDDFRVIAISDFDVNTGQFASIGISELAEEMEVNGFKWSEEV